MIEAVLVVIACAHSWKNWVHVLPCEPAMELPQATDNP